MCYTVTKLDLGILCNLNYSGWCATVGAFFSPFSVFEFYFYDFFSYFKHAFLCSILDNSIICNFGQLFLLIYNCSDFLAHTETHFKLHICSFKFMKAGYPEGVHCFASSHCPRLALVKEYFKLSSLHL